MAFPTIQDLLECGVHFGHQTRRWNPKMKKFIFAERNGIHIIDLKKTLNQLMKASDRVREITEKGGTILFVGTKKQMRDVIRDEAIRCGMYYVNERWLGGMITNFQTIKKNIRRLRELERMRDEGEFELRMKKEGLSLSRELIKLQRTLEGIKLLADIPDAMFVVDAQKEKIAVSEANKLGIPLIALIDTNADPEKVTYPVAGNDDAIRSVKMITQTIADAVLEGKARLAEKPAALMEKEPARLDAGQEGARDRELDQEQTRRGRPRRRPRRKRPGEEPALRSTAEIKAKAEEPKEPAAVEAPRLKSPARPAGDARPAGEARPARDARPAGEARPAREARPAGDARRPEDKGGREAAVKPVTEAAAKGPGEASGKSAAEKAVRPVREPEEKAAREQLGKATREDAGKKAARPRKPVGSASEKGAAPEKKAARRPEKPAGESSSGAE